MHSIPDIFFFWLYWTGFFIFCGVGLLLGFTYGKGLTAGRKEE
jgi:hypothetical protein